jgi:hypothetical protein
VLRLVHVLRLQAVYRLGKSLAMRADVRSELGQASIHWAELNPKTKTLNPRPLGPRWHCVRMCDQSSDRHKRNLFFLFFVLFISFSKNKKAIFPHLMFTKCFFPQTQRSRKKIWLMPFEEWHQPTGL